MSSDGSTDTFQRCLLPRKVSGEEYAYEITIASNTPGAALTLWCKSSHDDFSETGLSPVTEWNAEYFYQTTRGGAWIASGAIGIRSDPWIGNLPSATAIHAIRFEITPRSDANTAYDFFVQIANPATAAIITLPDTSHHLVSIPWYSIDKLVDYRNVAGSMLGTSFAAPTKAGGTAASASLIKFDSLDIGKYQSCVNAIQSYVIREDCADNIVKDGTYTYYVPRTVEDFQFRKPSVPEALATHPIIIGSVIMDDKTQDFRVRFYRNVEIRTTSKAYPQFAPAYDPSFTQLLTVLSTAPKASTNEDHEKMIEHIREIVCPDYAKKPARVNTKKPSFWDRMGSAAKTGLHIAEKLSPVLGMIV
jgi:hypothetical protein